MLPPQKSSTRPMRHGAPKASATSSNRFCRAHSSSPRQSKVLRSCAKVSRICGDTWDLSSTSRVQPSERRSQMRCIVIVKASKNSETGAMPGPELLAAMGTYNEELIKAGVMQGGGGLKPTSLGKRVRFSGAQRTVIDGPFNPTEEQVAGYWIWNVKSMDEAVEWLKRCPNPMPVDPEIEIRPEYEAADFARYQRRVSIR